MTAASTDEGPAVPSHPSAKSTASTGISSGLATGLNGIAPGHVLRRVKTIDVSDALLRPPPPSFTSRSESSFDGGSRPPRRSSNLSDYSSEARDILNPKPQADADGSLPESSSLASLSLAFALLPPISGALFKNGNAVVIDMFSSPGGQTQMRMQTGAGWYANHSNDRIWYHAAQQVRILHEMDSDDAIAVESDGDCSPATVPPGSPLIDVPEEDEGGAKPSPKARVQGMPESERRQAALRELYLHEVLSLLACLVLPLLSAYLLHTIRSQLSRPSEGLVSNYNLTIFLLVSELRVFSHMLRLVQCRTLHLQRVVHGDGFNPASKTKAQLEEMVARVERLEAHSGAEDKATGSDCSPHSARAKQEAAMTRDVRNAIQPELDALNRAVRRYEKKATVLQFQTESRFSGLEARLNDAITLAAAAAKNNANRKNVAMRAFEFAMSVALVPFHAMLRLLLLPLRTLLALIGGSKQRQPASTKGRSSRAGKAAAVPLRYSGDRVPPRVMKR
ncbi:hypothetical protein DCS_01208 [Drechmeria coniospora]|uniref:Uncharacterized protein n=1 Tax=Drechmeria coniospora TaxID=98403 RepID=A0A151GSI3_DRECN|nr:hypothetical protein DCS_01208 [Drechmeria coniospora]KYK60074.1 hypothetical protein DCS_01208 [Drechmeria coniospora]